MLPTINKYGIGSVSTLIVTFVFIAGLVASVILTQNQQEIRERAAPQPCYICQGVGVCQKLASPPYCNAGENECFVNEDCLPTPTPTPGACTVTSENRGCGRNNCSQTSMWQLVTNADCSITSRCVPNHPQCLPTPTPTPQTCTIKSEDRGCGRSGCSQTSMWQLVTNADCSVTDRCVPNHPQCSSTPTPTPTPTPQTCTVKYEDRGCGRNNCSQTSMWQLATNADCTTTSRCIANHPQCIPAPTPTPIKCENSKTVEQCDAQKPFCAWYACSNQCLPLETSYVDAGCAEPCPPLPGIPGGIQTCGFSGQTCETQFPLQGQLYMCQEGNWQEHGELRINFDDNCSEEEKNKYRDRLGILPLELHTNETIKISCPDEAPKFTVTIANEEVEGFLCGSLTTRGLVAPVRTNILSLSCNDPICQSVDYITCQYLVDHEFAHNHAESTQFWSSSDIESFNMAIGCRSDGKGTFSFEEKPVTSYGEANCAEAYAELIAFYVTSPCSVANNTDWSRQHEWLITNPDSPFQGKELCK